MTTSLSVGIGTRASIASPTLTFPSPTLTNNPSPSVRDDLATPTLPLPPESPRTNSCEPSFELKCSSLGDWNKEFAPSITGKAFEFWMHARECVAKFSSAFSVPKFDDSLMKGIVESVDAEFNAKGSMKNAQKETLKRDFHAMKKLKHSQMYFGCYFSLMDERHKDLMKEIRDLKMENTGLKGEVQSLCTVNNSNKQKFKRKENDLKLQALLQCGMKYSEKQKIGHKLFNQFGFVISKNLLTVHPKSIRKANDFGPNSSKAGRPFFKSFFKELLKKHNAPKAEDMAAVKNHELVYNSTLDTTVAQDQSNYLSGHYLDTKENRALIWYGSDTYGCAGVAASIIKSFNGKRSDESSKKIRPVLGMCISQLSSNDSVFFALIFILLFVSPFQDVFC